MRFKTAIIDLGTNTFHLLIAEGDRGQYRIVHRGRLAVKIGKDGINSGIITEEAIQRALLAMQSFRNTIHEHGVSHIHAFGTSAFRNAKNAVAVTGRIKALTGIDVNIISGDKEAEYIYYGVKAAVGLGDEPALIMDIGGGSVEFIIANRNHILWKTSIESGAQRLLEKYRQTDPITPHELQRLNEHFEMAFLPVLETLRLYPVTTLVGSSGTFDTLSDIFCERHQIKKSADEVETPLSLEGFYDIYDELLHKDRARRLQIPGMIEMRVDMIVVAVCMVRFLLEEHPFNRIRVSTYSLKEGVLSSLISAVEEKADIE